MLVAPEGTVYDVPLVSNTAVGVNEDTMTFLFKKLNFALNIIY
jgi:hypothetical protein